MNAIAGRAFCGELVVIRQLDALDALLDCARGAACAA